MFIIINITCAISIEPVMADEILNSYILSYIELYELTLNAIILIRNNKNDLIPYLNINKELRNSDITLTPAETRNQKLNIIHLWKPSCWITAETEQDFSLSKTVWNSSFKTIQVASPFICETPIIPSTEPTNVNNNFSFEALERE